MGLDIKAAQEEAESLGSSGNYEIEYLKLEEGPNLLRILPPFGNAKFAWVRGKKTYNAGPNQKTFAPKWDATCPAKQEFERLQTKGDPVSKKQADALYPKGRVYLWVVPRAPHKQADKRVLWDTNENVLKDIIGIVSDPDYGDITDAQKGTDVTVNYKSKDKTDNGFPEWKLIAKRNSTPLGTPDQIAAWTAEDWFIKHEIGAPSEDGWILAVLNGTNEAYIEMKKKEWAAKNKSGTTTTSNTNSADSGYGADSPPPATQSAPRAPGSTIRRKVMGGNPMMKYYVVDAAGNAVLVDIAVVEERMLGGDVSFLVMPEDQSVQWTTPDKLDFKIIEEVMAPPAPVAPPVAAPPPSPPKAPAPPMAPPPVTKPARKFFVFDGTATKETMEPDLQALVNAGHDFSVVLEGESEWKKAADYGIVKAAPKPPAAPTPPGLPPPPAGVPAPPLNSDLAAQVEALRRSRESGATSQVTADLRAKLG